MNLTAVVKYVALRSSWRTCRVLGACWGLGRFYRRRADYRGVAERVRAGMPHLRTAEARRIARRAAQVEMMRMCELLRLPSVSAQELRDYVDIEGMEYLRDAAADGCGIVSPLAHFGPFEIIGARVSLDFQVAGTSDPDDSPGREEHLTASRRAVKVETFPGAGAARAGLAALSDNKLVFIFADLPGGDRGLEMPLLGRTRCMQTSPARLAMARGAPILPGFPVRRSPWLSDGRVLLKVWPPLRLNYAARRGTDEYQAEIERGTRYFAGALEEMARAYPEEWRFW